MFGELTPGAIEAPLHKEIVGRIGYVDRRGLPTIEAVERISERLRTVAAATAAPAMAWRTFVTRSGGDGIVYRIHVTEKYERYSTAD